MTITMIRLPMTPGMKNQRSDMSVLYQGLRSSMMRGRPTATDGCKRLRRSVWSSQAEHGSHLVYVAQADQGGVGIAAVNDDLYVRRITLLQVLSESVIDLHRYGNVQRRSKVGDIPAVGRQGAYLEILACL